MHRSSRLRRLALALALSLTAARCAPTASPTPAPTPPVVVSPTQAPSPSPTNPPAAVPTPQPVTFAAPDGAQVTGLLYGAGDTAVIFSLMGDCVGDWAALAESAAAQGLMALTYQWRACQPGGVDNTLIRKFVDDLRGAVAFARAQGAERVILVGASLGGLASARLLAETGAVGLVVMAAPTAIPSWNVEVSPENVASAAPKLFITAEADDVVPAGATQALHDLAAEPKEFQTYPGAAHGTHLFATDSGEAAHARLLAFILAAAAAP